MRKLKKYVIILALLPALFITGCKKDMPEVEAVDYYSVLTEYLVDNGMDLPDLLSGWVIPAANVVDVNAGFTIPDYHVFDIRSQADYEAGHIDGAINVTLADVLTAAQSYNDKPILVVCYTGQTAGHAVMALRLSGYSDAKVLKWGMGGWNPAFTAKWEANSGHVNGMVADGNANWVTTAAPTVQSYAAPTWTATATDGAGILAERVQAMISGGFKATSSDPVLASPASYQIINFWDATDYAAYGHFDGAYQVKPISVANVDVFDPNAESLIYCYTGQTSSMATAWLNVLGYDVKSIAYGVNRLNYDGLYNDSKPTYHGAENYGYTTGTGTQIVNHFSILKEYMIDNDLDLPDMLTSWITTASNVNSNASSYYVFDIRSSSDYDANHIPGAINVALADVVTTAASYTDKPIVVACYTGQTAGHAVMALRLSGYTDAMVLKWGMSGWHTSLMGPWTGKLGNTGTGHVNWVTDASPATSTYANPVLTATANDGAGILAERVTAMLTGGLVGDLTSNILNNPGQYDIFNYWPESDYTTYGHFVGAYQYNTIDLENNLINAIDPDQTSVVYCYTGQTSSMITAWLNVLGYDILSGKFGAGNVIYDAMSGHKFVASSVVDLPLETSN